MHLGSQPALSRRRTLRIIGAGGLAALIPTVVVRRTMRAQEASPAPLPPLLAAFEAAWNANDDGTALAALFVEDAAFDDVPFGITHRGRAAIAAYAAANFAASSDLAIPTTAGFATDTAAANEWTYSGTYTGQFPGLPPGQGQSYTFRGSHVLDLVGGKIAGVRAYYDLAGLLTQLGLAGAPSATPSPQARSPEVVGSAGFTPRYGMAPPPRLP